MIITEPIKPPSVTYQIVGDEEICDTSDLYRFLDQCTGALFDALYDYDYRDCETVGDFVRQMLIEQAARYQIRRRGRPRGSRTRNPAENLPPSSLARRERRRRAEAGVFDKNIAAELEQGQ